MPLILPGNVASATAGAYDIANSVRMNSADTAYFAKTPSAGDRAKWTFSVWFKIGINPTDSQNIFTCGAAANNTDQSTIKLEGGTIDWWEYDRSETAFDGRLTTNRLIRDPSAWYHLVCTWDTDNGTAGNRMRMYINGTEETSFSTDNNPSSGYDSAINSNELHEIGRASWNSAGHFDGYFAEMAFCDGQAYAASDFGEFDEDSPTIWKPKNISTLTFGTRGWYLDFEDSGDLDDDESGNGNDWTAANLAAADQSTDTPTNNFATLNPLIEWYPGYTSTFSEGNLDVTRSDNGAGHSTIMVSSGKWYAEFKAITVGSGGNEIGAVSYELTLNAWLASNKGVAYTSAGNKVIDGTSSSYGDSYAANDIISIALNLDDGECVFYKNGTAQNSGTAISGFSTASVFAILGGGFGSTWKWSANFGTPSPSITISSGNADANGYGNFEYAVPSGYYALCTKNLGEFGG